MKRAMMAALAALVLLPAAFGARAEEAPAVPPAERILSVTAADHVLGRAEAPITIVEYASLTCPHCAAFHRDILPELKREWLDTGRAKLVFRHFPLDRVALDAARLVERADRDRALDLVGALLAEQGNWMKVAAGTSNGGAEMMASVSRIALAAGMTEARVRAAVADEDLAKEILTGAYFAQAGLNVQGTPSFFVNGKPFPGAGPYARFRDLLEAVAAGQ